MNNELLRQLYNRYYKEIYIYTLSLCQNSEQAEDLTQEAFLKALLSLNDEHTNMRAWLYMVARNLFLDMCRKKYARAGSEEIGENDIVSLEDPLNHLINDEKRKKLYEAMSKLNQIPREILIMHYFSNMSLKEISVILRLSPENVRVQAYRAKKELKKFMEEMNYEI